MHSFISDPIVCPQCIVRVHIPSLSPNLFTNCRFYIEAKDNGSPRLSSQVLVKVVVTDVNNNKPTFDRSFYERTISEDADIGTAVVQVSANVIYILGSHSSQCGLLHGITILSPCMASCFRTSPLT